MTFWNGAKVGDDLLTKQMKQSEQNIGLPTHQSPSLVKAKLLIQYDTVSVEDYQEQEAFLLIL